MFEAWVLQQSAVTAAEEKLREDVRSLDDAHKVEYFRRYNELLKDPDNHAVFNWFFLAGSHHFYR